MVFTRRATITIPDSEVAFTADSPLDLSDVLKDWSTGDRAILLSRPIFDPATLGRARFHNDNQGVIRGYLTARWLMRLRGENLSTSAIFDLLFARSYGVEVVKPSLNETVAWLAVWDRNVAHEVVRRSPSLLLDGGDPASLPPDVRRGALVGLLKVLTAGDQRPWHERPWWDNDKLRRFAQPDMGSVVVSLWPEYRTVAEAAQLLLRIAWLGNLTECAGIATEAASDAGLDSATRVFAGRTLLATVDESAKKRYAQFILAERATLPTAMLRDAMEGLFPAFVDVGDLLAILKSVDDTNDHRAFSLSWVGPRLIDKLDSTFAVQQLLSGLLTQLGGELGEYAHHSATEREHAYLPAIVRSALRLLKASPPEVAPPEVIDAILRAGNRRNHDSDLKADLNAAIAELHRTSSRRRFAFWRAAQTLRRPTPEWRKIEQLWQMTTLGYQPDLQVDDVDWLLEDGPKKDVHDRRLAINSALEIARFSGSTTDILAKIEVVANTDPVTLAAYDNWMRPREPSAEEVEMKEKLKEVESQNTAKWRKHDQTWIDFTRELRRDPVRVARLKMPTVSDVNPDLFTLWRLLDRANSRSRYAVESVAPLARIVGDEVAEAARQGLIAHWRISAPLLRSRKEPGDWSSIRWVDLLGLSGVSLEAASGDSWVNRLTALEATLAAGYATLELNGFPRWLSVLAASWPEEVRTVLAGEILDELARPDHELRYGTLNKVTDADDEMAALLAPTLLNELETRAPFPLRALSPALQILVRGLPQQLTPKFVKLGLERFATEANVSVAVQYLAAVFTHEAETATGALDTKIASLSAADQRALVDHFLIATFGDSIAGPAFRLRNVPAETLMQLVRLTFQTNDQSAVPAHPAGVVHKLTENDYAEHARSAVFYRFSKMPGAFTFQSLLKLQNDPACPIPPATLRSLAEERAIQDSESASWAPSEALAFEKDHETAPHTPKDLRSVLIHRLEDMQHDLLHGDFDQGLTLKRLPDEVDVQNWVADRLRLKQGRSFSVEREPHVAGEKEPDARVRAKATDASVAMEIKIADSWTLKQLEYALETQLCGRYLRANDGRYGVLLLIHQNPRRKRWKDTSGRNWLSFSEIVAHISSQAWLLAGAHQDSPQPEVCALDVSNCQARIKLTGAGRPRKSTRQRVKPKGHPSRPRDRQ
jgi:hypothetical protein